MNWVVEKMYGLIFKMVNMRNDNNKVIVSLVLC